MPANAGTLKIEITVDDKGTVKVKEFGRETERAAEKGEKGFKRTGQSLDDFDRKLAKAHANLLKIGVAAAALVGVYYKLDKFVKAASDLEEVTNKFNVVFAGQIETVEKWAKTLVESYAMSTRESKQYLSSVQDLLKPMGMQADLAAKMSFEIVKLSADLGSFNNLPTAQVMGDIQSALVGNYETMKKYGVVLNATVVQEKALALGLAKTKDELSAAQKAQAAYQLIVQGSADAVGDMERTSKSYANQLKQLKANIEDLEALIGGPLMESLNEVIINMNKWIEANRTIIELLPEVTTQTLSFIKNVLVYGAAFGGLKTVFNEIKGRIEDIINSLKKTETLEGPFFRGQIENATNNLRKFEDAENDVLEAAWEIVGYVRDIPPEITKWEDALVDVLQIAEDTVAYVRDTKLTEEKLAKIEKDMLKDVLAKADAYESEYEIHKKIVALQEQLAKEAGVLTQEQEEERVKETEKANKKIQADYRRMWERIHDWTADTFYDIFDGQIKTFGDFLGRMKEMFLRWLSEIAAAAVMKPIVLPIVTTVLGSSLLGGTAQAATTATAAQAMGTTGLLGKTLLGGATWTQLLGAGGLGGLGYSTVGNWLGLPQSQYSGLTSGVGSALGWMGGMAATAPGATGLLAGLGSLGGPLGLIFGGLLGGLFGSLFGKKKETFQLSKVTQYFPTGWEAGQGLGLAGAQNISTSWRGDVYDAYIEARNSVTDNFNQQMLSILSVLPDEYSKQAEQALNRMSFYYEVPGSWTKGKAQEAVTEAVENYAAFLQDKMEQITEWIFPKYAREEIMTSEFYGKLAPATQALYQQAFGGGYSAQDYMQMAQTFKANASAYEEIIFQMKSAAGILNDLEIQQYNVNKQFDQWIDTLKALGVAESEINAAEEMRAQALGRLSSQVQKDYLGLLTGATNPADIYERLAIMEAQLPKPGTALTEADLDLYRQYLQLAQEAYQRPSLEYQQIYELVKAAYEAFLEGLPSYQSGTPYVPVTGPAIVHKGEEIGQAGEKNSQEINVKFDMPISIQGFTDPHDAARAVEERIERFIRGRGRRVIQEAIKYQ